MKMKFDYFSVILIIGTFVFFSSALAHRTNNQQNVVADLYPDDDYLVKKEETINLYHTMQENKIAQTNKLIIKDFKEYIRGSIEEFEQLKEIINYNKNTCFNIFEFTYLLRGNKDIEERVKSMEFMLTRRNNYFYSDEYGNLLIYSLNEDLFDRTNFTKVFFVSKL